MKKFKKKRQTKNATRRVNWIVKTGLWVPILKKKLRDASRFFFTPNSWSTELPKFMLPLSSIQLDHYHGGVTLS